MKDINTGFVGILNSIFSNSRLPKWVLGFSAIIIVVTVLNSSVDVGALITSKLENDKQIQLQIEANRNEQEVAVLGAISQLNKDLNARLETVINAYNVLSAQNFKLSSDNSVLIHEVDVLRIQIEEKQKQLNLLSLDNDKLQNKITLLEEEIKLLNTRIDNILKPGP